MANNLLSNIWPRSDTISCIWFTQISLWEFQFCHFFFLFKSWGHPSKGSKNKFSLFFLVYSSFFFYFALNVSSLTFKQLNSQVFCSHLYSIIPYHYFFLFFPPFPISLSYKPNSNKNGSVSFSHMPHLSMFVFQQNRSKKKKKKTIKKWVK